MYKLNHAVLLKKHRLLKKSSVGKVIAAMLLLPMASYSSALQTLNDVELAAITGQSLLQTKYIAPGGNNPNSNVGFYRLGVNATMEINANINALQLGCTGTKQKTDCDVDIRQLRFAGIDATSSNDSGASSDFKLKNSFVEFAIKNPNAAATRQVVGLRFGALESLGSMSFGSNPDPSTLTDTGETGIESLSGDVGIHMINHQLTNVRACIGLLVFGACIGGWAPAPSTVADYKQTVTVKRAANLPDLGPITAVSTLFGSGGLPLTLSNIHLAGLPFRTNHRLNLVDSNNPAKGTSDFYMSVQKQDISWSKISVEQANPAGNSFQYTNLEGNVTPVIAAQKGWWMSLPSVELKDMVSTDQVSLDGIGALAGAIFNTRVDIAPLDLGQKPVDNCYGSRVFC